ncbi:MAG: hypothetical protein BWY76_00875 [bacterium ADurb.Bin429]|nr:MAG: hypothetical protein BWY76_00875 [bacterium ADurb.Bin429]
MSAEQPFTPTDWMPLGRGRSYNFYATDDEVIAIIRDAVDPSLRPCKLIGVQTVEEAGSYRQTAQIYNLMDSFDFDVPLDSYTPMIYIWPLPFVPDLPLYDAPALYLKLSYHGLVCYERPNWSDTLKPGHRIWRESSLLIVDRVINRITGEERSFPEMYKLFTRLRRKMNTVLVYSTIQINPHTGCRYEDSRPGMSEGVYQQIVTGKREYDRLPGHRLA